MAEILTIQELIQAFIIALGLVADNIHWVILGVLIGTIFGLIPGLSGLVGMVVVMPFTMFMETYPAFALMCGILGATSYAGGIAAVLINAPGTSSNAATLIDGYPIMQKGRGMEAIVASAVASAAGAVVGLAIFVFALPLLVRFVILFGPSEIFWLVAAALVFIPVVIANDPRYGVMTAALGGFVALVGVAPQTGESRFTFGIDYLLGGVNIMTVLVGLFAIAEVARLISLNRDQIAEDVDFALQGERMDGVKTWFKHRWLWLRCSVIGIIVGAVPGAGGTAAAFLAYGHAVQSSGPGEKFGTGRMEGVIAPQSANDAKDGGQMFPTLGLGIPGSASMALLLAAMLMHGIFPSPRLILNETYLVYVIIISFVISNILVSVIGILFVKQLMKVVTIPIWTLFISITVISISAVIITRNQMSDVLLVLIFGAIGLLFMRMGLSRIPFIIAFILVSLAESSYLFALELANGDWGAAFLTGTLNRVLVAIFLLSLLSVILPRQYQDGVKEAVLDKYNAINPFY